MNKIVERLNGGQGLTGLKIVQRAGALLLPPHRPRQEDPRGLSSSATRPTSAPACSSAASRSSSSAGFDNNNALVAAHGTFPKSIVVKLRGAARRARRHPQGLQEDRLQAWT